MTKILPDELFCPTKISPDKVSPDKVLKSDIIKKNRISTRDEMNVLYLPLDFKIVVNLN